MADESDEDEDIVMIQKDDEQETEEAKNAEDEAEDNDEERLLSDVFDDKLLEGYCLVFEREREYFQMEMVDLRMVGDERLDLDNMDSMCNLNNVYGIKNDNDKTLSWVRKPDIADQEFNEKAPKRCKGIDSNNLLKGFNSARIQYKIIWSRPSIHCIDEKDKINPNDDIESKYIYVVLWMDEKNAEKYADYQDISVLINREEAIKAGRQFDEFYLAHRTYLASIDDDDKVPVNEIASRKAADDDEIVDRGEEVQKLPIECWNNMHIPFEFSIKNDPSQYNIYELYPAANNHSYKTVVTHRMYLRILYSCLVDDYNMRGANFALDRYLRDKNNPFLTVFALHEYDNHKFYPNRPNVKDINKSKCSNLMTVSVPKFAQKLFQFGWVNKANYRFLNDDLREYFGEDIAYYYAFLIHYLQSMWPMVVIGLIWFIIQLGSGTISVGGSTFYVLICIMWSTMMIETWYRKERALLYKWGMCRYRQTEVPRPTFRGKVKVSPYNGDIIEDHRNILKYYAKIVFSLSTMVLCIAVVITVVGTIWILKRRWKDNPEFKMAIGIINAIQIKVFNVLYMKLASALNNFEEHRLVEDYYNHLVIKRIIFMVVNSFNSLFYMAFYDDSYVDNQDRLNSLRIQLATLFITSIVLLNFLEVVIPQIPKWIRQCKQRKKKNDLAQNVEAGLHIADTSERIDINLDISDPEGELKDPRFTGGLDPMIIVDIERQINSPKLASTLDNVAEIVILQGYIIVFAVVLPLMPLLAYINAIVEIRIDVYNLTGAQRPFPLGADGIGVWRAVLSIFNTLAIFSNMAVIAWDTNLPEVVLGLKISGKIIWYFLICLGMLMAMICVRLLLPDESAATKQAMARQEQCENLVTLLQDSSPKIKVV